MSQELEARLVSPVQVVEHEDHGTLVGGRFEKTHDRGIEEVPLCVGVGRLRWRELPETLTGGRAPIWQAPHHGKSRRAA